MHHHVTTCAPIQTYANNHMIVEVAESRIGASVPRPFPRVVGSGNETMYWCAIFLSESAQPNIEIWGGGGGGGGGGGLYYHCSSSIV